MARPKKNAPCVLNSEQQALVTENILLVAHVLKRGGLRGLEYDDAFQIGALGLMRAAVHYNKARGAKFSTYAITCIERSLASDLRARLTARCGHGDKPLSLDYKPASGRALADTVCSRGESLEDQFDTSEAIAEFKRVVGQRAAAGAQAAKVAWLYWIDGLSQTEVAERVGVSKQRVNCLVWKEMRRFKLYWT